MKFVKITLLIISLFWSHLLIAGTTGKLAGIVKDKNTGEPLAGVNIILQGTMIGGATDIDGVYTILDIPAGYYTIVFKYLGYKDVVVENIRIVPDITTRLNVEMEETAIELGGTIVVVAERPFFEASATNTVRVLDSEEIEKVPVKGINQIVGLNAGVVMSDGSGGETENAVLNIRGGRGNETLVIIDGIPYNNVLSGYAQGTIPDVAIEQVSAQLGGFSAKYGSAQSGIINIVTKSGGTKFRWGFEGISSEYTDPYDYNAVNGYLSGALIPGNKHFSFFVSGEYINAYNDRPRAVGLEIPSKGIKTAALPYADSRLLRFSSKINGDFTKFKFTYSLNGSFRNARSYIHSYAKNNADHNPKSLTDILGTSLKLTYFFNPETYIDIIGRYRQTQYRSGDGVWFDNLDAYGDTLANKQIGVTIPGQGSRVLQDEVGVFFDKGRVYGNFTKYFIQNSGIDINFTKQYKKHLIEIGGSYEQHSVRYYSIYPPILAIGLRDNPNTPINERLPRERRYLNARPAFYGYDITGNWLDETRYRTIGSEFFEESGPKRPIVASLYFQDKIEFNDFILNLGLRWDYFNPKGKRLKDKNNIFRFGKNPNRLDPEDFEPMPIESYFSPRLGFAFPVTAKTVFHAQYGIFRQTPRLTDLYPFWFQISALERDDNRTAYNGYLQSESTTQYEFGFKQQIGNFASIDITAFYKNVKGLTNIIREKSALGQDTIVYLTTANTDFGVIKGLALSFTLRRLGPISAKADYTLQLAEGTGSSQSSNFIAAFRNIHGEVPKTIAPLSFDQRHTFTATLDYRYGKDQGPTLLGRKLLQNFGASFLITYNSGRPYTPIEWMSVLPGAGSNQGDLTEYINSAYAKGIFRIDLKMEKTLNMFGLRIIPYLWVINLFDRKNYVSVYRSTGLPDRTLFLETDLGKAFVASASDPQAFITDYRALERNPNNYGQPRMIRLGLRIRY